MKVRTFNVMSPHRRAARADVRLSFAGCLRRSGAGFTLLEVLLAVSVLVAVSSLAASLYVHADGMTRSAASADSSMRLQRVMSLAADQWADRRALSVLNGGASDDRGARRAAGGDDGRGAGARNPWDEAIAAADRGRSPAAVFMPEAVSFVTGTPLLFPDWPLVVATYRIVRVEEVRVADDEPVFALTYRETRVLDVARGARGVEFTPERTPDGEPTTDALVLLYPLAEARFERFGPAFAEGDDEGDADGGGGRGGGVDGSRASGGRLGEARARVGAFGRAPAEAWVWRRFDRPFAGEVRSARLRGVLHEEEFTWPFVAERLR